jgi:hypothetical protein
MVFFGDLRSSVWDGFYSVRNGLYSLGHRLRVRLQQVEHGLIGLYGVAGRYGRFPIGGIAAPEMGSWATNAACRASKASYMALLRVSSSLSDCL